jgi:uncharacterized damage-inducible protein DinB
MKRAIQMCVIALGALIALSATAAAQTSPTTQTATIHGDLVKDWTAMKDMMAKIAEAMPEDKYGFKPTPAQRSFGEHVMHIAQVNMMLIQSLGAKTPAPAINMNATTKADRIKAMTGTFDYAIAVINGFDNKTIQDTIQAPFMGPSTRARILFFLLGHTWDTYGQMAVYLRLNGVTPPASARP